MREVKRQTWVPDAVQPSEHFAPLELCPSRCHERGMCKLATEVKVHYCMCFAGWHGSACE
jgi:hypothetical protein